MNEMADDVELRVMEVIRQAVELDQQNDIAFATQILTAVVAEFPGLAIGHSYLGWILSRGGRHREAIEHGRVAVQLSPQSEKASLALFRVLWGAGERDLAFEEMKRFVAIGHSNEYSLMMKEWEQIENEGQG
jgi:tetratricopeptide (TPR) repeat protein